MIYVFHGKDQFRAREELNALRRELDRDGNLIHNTTRLEGRGLTPADLRAACHATSFFVEARLVIVEGLQERFRGTRRGRRPARATNPDKAASEFEQMVEVLTSMPESTTVVLLDESTPTALIEALGKDANVQAFEVMKGQQLRSWAAARAKQQDAKLTPAALDRLVGLIDGAHIGQLANEIDKLAVYAAGRTLEVYDIDALVSAAIEYQFWDLTDAVVEGRSERAIAVLKAMDAKDNPAQLLAYMLVRQYRQLIVAQSLIRQGLSADQIGSQMGISGYPLKKVVDAASRYPADRLETAYRRLLASDVAVKTGVLDVEVALEMLVVELSELARNRTPGRAQAAARAPVSGGNWRR